MCPVLTDPPRLRHPRGARCEHCKRKSTYRHRHWLVVLEPDDPFSKLEWWCSHCVKVATGIDTAKLGPQLLPTKREAKRRTRIDRSNLM